MSLLIRASTMPGRPVVTLTGDELAEVKDVIFHPTDGRVLGFTLRGSGFFSRKRKEALAWESVYALGPDAVMVADEDALSDLDAVVPTGQGEDASVLGDRVLTKDGTHLGEVTDVVIEVSERADVVGYEIVASEALAERKGRTLFIPIPDTLAISGEALIVPSEATEYVRDDLAGFGEAVEAFRSRLGGSPDAFQRSP